MKYQINDIELNVCDQGLGEQVLFFLHYWGGSLRTWGEVIKRLENHFRCIAYDHRGWGNSDAPPSGYRMEDLAHDAEGLIRKLGLRRYVLIGHSMGGKVAQLLASWHPAGLEGLLLVAPSPPVPMTVTEEQRKRMIEPYGKRQDVEVLIPIFPLGMINAHLIRSDHGCILVDAGLPESEKKIQRALRSVGLSFVVSERSFRDLRRRERGNLSWNLSQV